MLQTAYAAGSTDVTVYVRGFVASTGLPATDVAFNTAGIAASYIREGAASTSITLATQTASGAHSDGGFVHVAGGVYRLDLPDAAVASGVDYVVVQVNGVSDRVFSAATVEIASGNPRSVLSEPIDVNVTQINGTAVIGAGTSGDKWRA